MIGAAAERNRQVEGAEARIDEIEQRRIFDRKLAREPGFAAVSDREPRLKTIDALVGGEARRGQAQLIRRRNVLGVVDDNEFAPGARQRDIERPRLGLRQPRRGDDDLVAAGEFELDEPVQGFGIALFDDQLDVELALWVVRYYGANATGDLTAATRPFAPKGADK